VRDVTFSADERAREVARSEGKTLEDAFHEWLDSYGSRIVVVEVKRQRPKRSMPYFGASSTSTPDGNSRAMK
jgi:hypothetical protein